VVRVVDGSTNDQVEAGFTVGGNPGSPGAAGNTTTTAGSGGSFKMIIEPAPTSGPLVGADTMIQANSTLREMVEWLNKDLKLPRDIPITFRSVPGKVNAWYEPSTVSIIFGYEFIPFVINSVAAAYKTKDKSKIAPTASQTLTFVLLHEIGHALRHQLALPITGQEEDVVDEFATLSLIQKGHDSVAFSGAVTFLGMSKGKVPSMQAYLGVHALGEQRFGTIMCLIYGSDPKKYAAFVGKYVLQSRAGKCQSDFKSRNDAWKMMLEPHRKKG
jgi:hypothetical protein